MHQSFLLYDGKLQRIQINGLVSIHKRIDCCLFMDGSATGASFAAAHNILYAHNLLPRLLPAGKQSQPRGQGLLSRV